MQRGQEKEHFEKLLILYSKIVIFWHRNLCKNNFFHHFLGYDNILIKWWTLQKTRSLYLQKQKKIIFRGGPLFTPFFSSPFPFFPFFSSPFIFPRPSFSEIYTPEYTLSQVNRILYILCVVAQNIVCNLKFKVSKNLHSKNSMEKT